MLPFIHIGSLQLQSYLFMAVVAFLASTLLIVLRRKSQNIAAWEAIALSCTTLVGGVIGAKIFHLAGRVNQSIDLCGKIWYHQTSGICTCSRSNRARFPYGSRVAGGLQEPEY